MKSFILMICVLFNFIIYSQVGRQTHFSNNLYFLNNEIGWLHSYDDTAVYRTTDSGLNWEKNIHVFNNWEIQFINDSVGFFTNYFNILKTTDKGISWEIINDNVLMKSDIHFLDLNNAYIITFNGKFLRSSDGGIDWDTLSENIFREYESSGLWFVDSNNIYLLSHYGVKKSTDGGYNWFELAPRITHNEWIGSYLSSICFIDSKVGFVSTVGNDEYIIKGGIWRTEDGGANWTYNTNMGDCFDIFFTDSLTGYARMHKNQHRWLIRTTDKGITWDSLGIDFFASIYFINNLNGFGIGMSLVKPCKTTNGGYFWDCQTTNIEDRSNNNYNYLLNQNYPNPFNPTTTISYSLSKSGFTTLKVFDILGRAVITLVNEEKPVGSYTVEFNASNLSSGVYFYSLTSGSFTMNKKMILMK